MKSPDSPSKLQAAAPESEAEGGQSQGKTLAAPAFELTAGGGDAPGGQGTLPNGLPIALSNQIKTLLGVDPSQAVIHKNSGKAAEIGALAFVQGNEIHFAPGKFNPNTREGKELIGHEFTHYKQQMQGLVQPTSEIAGMPLNEDPALEAAADAMGAKIAAEQGGAAAASAVAGGGGASSPIQAKMEAAEPQPEAETAAPEAAPVPAPEQGDEVDPAVRMAQEIAAEAGDTQLAALPDQQPTQVPENIQQPSTQTQTSAEQQAAGPAPTGAVVQRWGWLKKAWNGVKSVAKGAWNGIKSGAKAVWNGAKAVAKVAWKGIKAVGGYVWNVIKSVAALGHALVIKIWPRIWKLITHLGSGAADLVKWVWTGIKTTVTNPRGLGKWFVDGLKGGGAWVGRLVTKLLDVIGFAEILDLIGQVIKFNTRSLTGTEIEEAKKVFGSAVPYWKVRVDEHSLIANIGKWFQGGKDELGVVVGYTINLTTRVKCAAGNEDMAWIVHELTHAAQCEAIGLQYIPEALIAQHAGGGYEYGGPNALAGKHLRDFNREQQGDICRDYYYKDLYKRAPSPHYLPLIEEARRGEF
jgi:Domain of unknown function (DUF4157)